MGFTNWSNALPFLCTAAIAISSVFVIYARMCCLHCLQRRNTLLLSTHIKKKKPGNSTFTTIRGMAANVGINHSSSMNVIFQ